MSQSWWQRVKHTFNTHKNVGTTVGPVEENFHSVFTSGETINTSEYEIKLVGLSIDMITFKVLSRGIPHINAPGTTPNSVIPFEPGAVYRVSGIDFQHSIATCSGRLFGQYDEFVYELVSSPENSNQTKTTKPSEETTVKPAADNPVTVAKLLDIVDDINSSVRQNYPLRIFSATLTEEQKQPPNQGTTPMPDTTTAATPTAASVKPDDTQQKLVKQLKEIDEAIAEKPKQDDRLLPTASDDVLTVSPGDILTTEDGRQGKLVLSSPDEAVLLIDSHYEVREWSKVKKIRFCPVKPKLFTNR